MREEAKQNCYWATVGILVGSGIPMLTPNCPIIGGILIFLGIAMAIYTLSLGRKESRLKSIKSAVRNSQCTWAFLYTGGQILDNNVIKTGTPTSIKKLILLKPDLNNDAFNYITNLAGSDTLTKREKDIANINSLIETVKSASTKVDIYYHSEKLAYTFIIYDDTPQTDGENELPKSKNAWITVQPLEPKRANEIKDWHKWIVKNKGNTKDQFEAYYDLFCNIEGRAERVNNLSINNAK